MLLGVRIRDLRKKKGLTQYELAKRINVTKSTISYYENNLRIPTVSNLHELANALGVSFDFLMGNDTFEGLHDDSGMFLAKEELEFIHEVRRYPKLHSKMIENPKRFVSLMNKKL